MGNALLNALRLNDQSKGKKSKGYFNNNASLISYSTGFPTLDYALGYKVNIFNKKNELINTYPSLGITAGSYVLFTGKPGTSKTAAAIKIAANIIRPFENGMVIHYDLEQATQYSRIQALTRMPINELYEKYILRQENITLNDIKASIIDIYNEKVNNPDKYKYNTGKKNEFNEDIILYEPTVIILDSIATITNGLDAEIEEDISKQTDKTRLAGEISRFFNEVLGPMREANIILIAINQIKQKIAMNAYVHEAADILGLGQNESLPGGKTHQYLAHILLKFEANGSEKFTVEDDGFIGFGVRIKIIKSRVSAAMNVVNMIYDSNSGINMIRSTVRFAKDSGLLGGNKNGYYFTSNKDDKFTLKNMPNDFKENPNLYKIMHDTIMPVLEQNLSGITPEEISVPQEETNFYDL